MRNLRNESIEIQFATSRRDVPHAATLRTWAKRALPSRQQSICIRVVGRAESRTLNRKWRGKDKPTNVLSFPYGPSHAIMPSRHRAQLGDIVICAPVVAREAREQGKTLNAHWAHMVVHGILHLTGHDHVKNRDAIKMAACEVEILAQFGYQDPYQG